MTESVSEPSYSAPTTVSPNEHCHDEPASKPSPLTLTKVPPSAGPEIGRWLVT